MIQKSDIIIANATIPFLLRGPMELLLAKYFNKLTISIINKKSLYYNNETIHPWLDVFSDYVVESIRESIDIIKEYQVGGKINIKLWDEILYGKS